MAWLVRGTEVLASLEIARDRRARMRGLLGRDGLEGALYLAPARSVHTVRMRFAIDVAYLDRDLTVVKVATMVPNRVGWPVWRATGVIETEAGAMRRWALEPGDQLTIAATEPEG